MEHPKYKLGRTQKHDIMSLFYPFNTDGLSIIDVEHKRLVPVFDQGQVGSCTGNAGNGNINTEPFLPNTVYSPDENGALQLYKEAEIIDGGIGYPPEDVGSCGLSIAKALQNAGLISGYQHTFTLNDCLKALSVYPVIVGIPWYSNMFYPDADGRVHPTGNIVGGHEIEAYKVDVANGRIWFWNSWGNWGVNGTFYLTWADFASLLSQGGDVTVLLPKSVPAPVLATTAVITRGTDDGIQTMGILSIGGFNCKTLERSWKNNQTNISSIPKGTYTCKYVFWLRKLKYTYELQNVTGRSGIKIHSGNYFFDTAGCILLGDSYGDINKDGELDILNSTVTIKKFEQLMGKKDFQLTIQ
jgi:hypothetical protein